MQNYMAKVAKLNTRRTDPSITTNNLYEIYGKLTNQDESTRYALQAMQPVEPEYTANTMAECRRIENQLSRGYQSRSIDFEFRHQGSVTNNTHIKAHSDIDLLSIHGAFITLQHPQTARHPYNGNPVNDLLEMRDAAHEVLSTAFPEADIDNSGDKCLTISGGSLKRKIDVVPSNWYNTNEYVNVPEEYIRGIMVYSRSQKNRLTNYPFFHNHQIEQKDIATGGNLRKAIRLLKSIKYDSDQNIELSSFDIASICWNMESELLMVPKFAELQLVQHCNIYVTRLISNEIERKSIDTPDRTRRIFDDDSKKLPELKKLGSEVRELVTDIATGARKSFAKLEEARIPY